MNRVGYFTVPELAIYWGIHQEFAYQLVNMGLLGYEVQGRTRYIRDMHVELFSSKYTILTHFIKEQRKHTKTLSIDLKSIKKKKTIDHDWEIKLRQRVYLKGVLESFLAKDLTIESTF